MPRFMERIENGGHVRCEAPYYLTSDKDLNHHYPSGENDFLKFKYVCNSYM
jgi:hypothetical protein